MIRIEKTKNDQDFAAAMELVRRVFLQLTAPDYEESGIRTFLDFIENKSTGDLLDTYCAYNEAQLIGVISTRNAGSHLSLFFVTDAFQRQGVGKLLFETVLEASSSAEFTVHSSPYAVDIYRKLGFEPLGSECVSDGIRYTPMIYRRESGKRLIDMISE
ncbi:MAG: GNAT family N-acetyltransferase [Anaerofustis sp.]